MAQYVKKTNNPRMGRPKIDIDPNQLEKLCAIQCTEEEIAGWFDCSVDTLERFCKSTYKMSFAELYKMRSSKGKISLRRTQFKLSETSVAMAIFLGKQYLGQSDVIENHNTFEDLTPLAEMLKINDNESATDD